MRSIHLPPLLLLLACGRTTGPSADTPPPVPEPFQERSVLADVKSRGYEGDVVERMFAEELEHDTALAALFERAQLAARLFRDSAHASLALAENDRAFYASANVHAAQLTDSLDRQRMMHRLDASAARAEARFSAVNGMQAESTALNDGIDQLRTRVMLDRTLQRMEAYQRTPVPGKAGMQEALQRLRKVRDELREQADQGNL